ncbi:ATP-binding protein [Flagellimonas sp. CMM7]|uniref:tetratricopeptide repeat-containing sensor histidine kinase n=1 Tax=Flagellimonas sp. CMM7 TaxID=2654676 RepID=UPI0013D272E2|nr:ATP-binding protein [Flagellimonas sp. CMM7]UII79284.1 ATP-binding protein [Flagellimonas sp. CMM7]
MKNKYLILLFIVLSSCDKQLSVNKSDTTSKAATVEEWINIASDSAHFPLSKRKQFLKKAESKISEFSNDTLRLEQLSKISLIYKRLQDSLEFRKMNRRVTELSEKDKLYMTLGESHWDLASFFRSYGVLDSAYFHYKKAHKGFNELPVDSTSRSLRGRILYSMGRIQDYFKDYLGAEVNLSEALRIFEDLEDYKRIYNCNNMLGVISNGTNNQEKALEYFYKAESFIKKFKPNNKMMFVRENRNNIASTFLEKKEYNKAFEEYQKLFEDKDFRKDDPRLYSLATISQAHALFKGQRDYAQASTLLLNAIKINDSIGFSLQQARAKQLYAEILAAQGDTIIATQYAKESRELAKESSNDYRNLEVLKVLTSLDSENAVAYSNEYYELSEKIKDEERAIRDKFARIRLETDEVIQRNELLSRQKQIWIGVVLGLILLGIALFTIIWQRISNNRLKFQQKQQESNQEIYNLMLSQQGKFEEGKQLEQKRVSEELHDGILGQMLGIRLILSGLNDKDDEASVEQRASLIEKLRELEEEIRTISHELSDASYQKFYNFIVSLDDLINTISESSGISCSFTYDENVDWDDLEGDIKINAYRIVQEALQNCVKHAKCENAQIDFRTEDNLLILSIKDDGVGFDMNKGKRGIGLRNVVSRVKKVKGTLDIDSKKGKGTTVTVSLPSNYIRLDTLNAAVEHKEVMNV